MISRFLVAQCSIAVTKFQKHAEEERFVLAHNFRDFSPGLLDSITSGGNITVETCSEERHRAEREGKGGGVRRREPERRQGGSTNM